MFEPTSPQTQSISNVFIITLILGGLVFALVAGLVIYAIIKFRHRSGVNDNPSQLFGNNRLEIGWTIGPSVLAVGLLVLTFIGIANSDPATPQNQTPDIQVIGHQWWWEYRFPKEDVITANELHIPTGKRLFMELWSADVIHDFWVPQLARKMDTNISYKNHTWLQSDQQGVFLGTCAEYCGNQHAGMLIRVIAQPPADFETWVQQQKQVPPAPTAPRQARGAEIFQRQTCVNCHYIAGTDAKARVGPDLTHLGSRTTLGSGVISNTPENLDKWIRNPNDIKPGVNMPPTQLSDQEVNDLVAYLEALK